MATTGLHYGHICYGGGRQSVITIFPSLTTTPSFVSALISTHFLSPSLNPHHLPPPPSSPFTSRWPLYSPTGGYLTGTSGLWKPRPLHMYTEFLCPCRAMCASHNTSVAINITVATGTCTFDPRQRIGTLAGITAGAVVLGFARIFLIVCILVNAGCVLHDRMFASMMRVPIRFYDTNPSGKATPTRGCTHALVESVSLAHCR